MKIRYPGPSVPIERRDQAEYFGAFDPPIAVLPGHVIEVPDAHGKALIYTGMVERMADDTPLGLHPKTRAPKPAAADQPAKAEAAEKPEKRS